MGRWGIYCGVTGLILVGLGCAQTEQQAEQKTATLPADTRQLGKAAETRFLVKIQPSHADQRTNLKLITEGGSLGPEYVLQWFRNGEPIEGATKDRLLPEHFRKGDWVSAKVTPPSGTGQLPVEAEPVRIANTPPEVTSLQFRPKAPTAADAIAVGVHAWDNDKDNLTYRYVWKRNGEVVSGVEGAELPAGQVRRGDAVSVTVAAYDGEVWGEERESEVIRIANGSPVITSSVPARVQFDRVFYYDVKAQDPDGDELRYSLTQFPEGMAIHAKTGRIAWPVGSGSLGKHQVVVEVADGHGGAAKQAFELSIEKGAAR